MSRGSNTDDINMVFVDRLVNAIGDLTQRIEELNTSLFKGDFFDKAMSKHMATYKSSGMTSADMEKFGKALAKDLENYLKVNYNVGMTKRGHSTVEAYFKGAAEKYSGKDLTPFMNQMKTSIKNLYSSMTFESMRGAERGEKKSKLYLTNTLDNERLKDTYKEFAKSLGIKLDETQDKFMNFFKDEEKKREKKTRGFIDDLIEGLSKSKWIGGALHDTFRLIGFLGANWLSHFGKLGKILGGAFYVAMETFGPTLLKLLGEAVFKGLAGLSRALWGLVASLGTKAGWGLINRLPQNGPLGNAITTFYGGGTTAQKAAAAGRLAGTGLVAGGAMAGGGWAIGQATDSWKKGKKGNAAAFAVGGAGLIAGGIAALVAGLTAPITVPLLAISAAVVGLAALWKHHSETIKKWAASFGKFVAKILDFVGLWEPIAKVITEIKDFVWNMLPESIRKVLSGDKDNGSGGGSGGGGSDWGDEDSSSKKPGFFAKLKDALKLGKSPVGKLQIAQSGAVMNARNFSQRDLRTLMEEYQRKDPSKFGNIYEVVSSKYAAVNQFRNDAVMVDKNTGKLGAIMYKGASADMERIRELARKAGMSEDRVKKILYTGGWSTASGAHTRNKNSVAASLGHDNPWALAYDIGLAGFSAKEQTIITQSARQAAKERAERIGGSGAQMQNARHEVKVNGKYQFSDRYQAGANPMVHTQLYSGYVTPEGASLNMQKAKATQPSIKVMGAGAVLKAIDAEKYKEVSGSLAAKFGDDATRAALYGYELKKRGITKEALGNTGVGGFTRTTKDGAKEVAVSDPRGNITWMKTTLAVQQLQQFSAR